MRRAILLSILLGACGGANDAASDTTPSGSSDATTPSIAVAPQSGSERPVIGTLRFNDHDVALTTDALDARGNEDLRRMTAGVMADVAPDHVREVRREDLTGIQADLF